MANLVPVDYDPFAAPAQPGAAGREPGPLRITVGPNGGPRLVPVDHDPFAEEQPRQGGAFMNATAGLNEGIYGALGAPVDLAAGALNLGIRGINSMAGMGIPEIADPIGGSRSLAKGFGLVGVPDPQNVDAKTLAEHVLRAAGQGAGTMVAPEAAVRGAAQAVGKSVGPMVSALLGNSSGAGDLAANAAIGAASGVGARLGGELAPEPYRPMAEMAGGMVGGGLGAGAILTPRAIVEGARMGGDYAAPLTEAGRQRLAGEALRDAASDPATVRAALEKPAQLVPGSQPTTFQQTGDMGLGGLERVAATRAPEQFMQRRAEQNSARLGALGALQPEGSASAVVGMLRQNLTALDEATAAALAEATQRARATANALGGRGTPETYGVILRQHLGEAEAGTRVRERALWAAVDPDGTLALDVSGVKKAADTIRREMPVSARPIEGEEAGIFDAASAYRAVMPFKELTALRSRTSTAMREELSTHGQTPVYARLSRLRGAIEQAIESAVTDRAADDAHAVASGAMRQEDTMLAQWERKRQEWYANQEAGAEAVRLSGGDAAARSTAFSSASGARGQSRGRFSDASSDPGLSGHAGLAPNFDRAAAERLKAANDATKARAQTYGTEPVKGALRRSGKEGPYELPASIVPSRFFRSGPRGFEDAQAFRQAAGPEAMGELRDYALSTLRRAAEREDGTFDPAKVVSWRERHADALRAFPDIDKALADPVKAAEAVTQAAAARKAALDARQAGVVARLIKADDPADVTRIIGSVFASPNSVATMRRLVREVQDNPEALAGLRKAVADHIAGRLVGNTEAGTSGQSLIRSDAFQQFLRSNGDALKEVFDVAELETIKAIAADLQRANRSIAAVKLPGQSNTAQDLAATARATRESTVLQRLVSGAGQGTAGLLIGGTLGGPAVGAAAAIIGGQALTAMRNAGLRTVDDLITDAMLNPARARLLLERVGEGHVPSDLPRRITEAYRRATMVPALIGEPEEDAPPTPQRHSEARPAGMPAILGINARPQVPASVQTVANALLCPGVRA